MESKVSMIIQSHLSDAALEMSFNPDQAELRINFVKFLVHTYPDTNVRINPHPIYKQWYADRFGIES
jgi:hypothetical protein